MKRLVWLSTLIALSSCGTPPGLNSDVPVGIYAGDSRPVPENPSGVTITDTGPRGTQVYGLSCKSKMWDPEPSRENAISLMKQQAKAGGFNAIHTVIVNPEGASLLKNCWSSLQAYGIAYNLQSED